MKASNGSLIARVSRAMQEIAPLSLADRSWDNVGVLLESPPLPAAEETVLVTVDLTAEVLREAMDKRASVIVAYHPPIFRPLRRLTLEDDKQLLLLRAVQAGISVYSPHTSLDAVRGGVNDWLARLVDKDAVSVTAIQAVDSSDTTARASVCNCDDVGYGRVVRLRTPSTLPQLVRKLKQGLRLPTLRVARPSTWTDEHGIASVAVCAGSGASVFRALATPVELLLTGELGHHDVLAATARGQAVILCEHSNTERGYLRDELTPLLHDKLGEQVSVIFAATDRDPLVTW